MHNAFQIAPFRGKDHCVFKFRSEYADETEGEYDFTAENIHALYAKALTGLRLTVSSKIQRSDIPECYPEVPAFPAEHITYDELFSETSENQSMFSQTRIVIDGYSLLLTRDYMFVAKRAKEDRFNSISFSGIAFAKN